MSTLRRVYEIGYMRGDTFILMGREKHPEGLRRRAARNNATVSLRDYAHPGTWLVRSRVIGEWEIDGEVPEISEPVGKHADYEISDPDRGDNLPIRVGAYDPVQRLSEYDPTTDDWRQ